MSDPNEINEIQQIKKPYKFERYRLNNIGHEFYQHNTWIEDYRLYRENLSTMIYDVTCQIDIYKDIDQQIDHLVLLCVLRDLFTFKLNSPNSTPIDKNETTLIRILNSLTDCSISQKDILPIAEYRQLIINNDFLTINVEVEHVGIIKNSLYKLILPIRQLLFDGTENNVLIDEKSFEDGIGFVIPIQVWLDIIAAIMYYLKTPDFFNDKDVKIMIEYLKCYFDAEDLIGAIERLCDLYVSKFNVYIELDKKLKNINNPGESELMLQLYLLANNIYLPPIRKSIYTNNDLIQIIELQKDLIGFSHTHKEEFKANKYFISPGNTDRTCLLNGMFNKMLLMMFGDHLWPFDDDPIEPRFKMVDDYEEITVKIADKIMYIYDEWLEKFFNCENHIANELAEKAKLVLSGSKIDTVTVVEKFITNTVIFEPLSYLIGAIIGDEKIPLTYVYIPLFISFGQLVSDLSNLYYFEFCNGFKNTGHPDAIINGKCTYGETNMLLMTFKDNQLQTLDPLIFTKHGKYNLLEIVSNLITIHLKKYVFKQYLMCIDPYQDVDINEYNDDCAKEQLEIMNEPKALTDSISNVLSEYIEFLVEQLPEFVDEDIHYDLLMREKWLIKHYITGLLKFINIDIYDFNLFTDHVIINENNILLVIYNRIYRILKDVRTFRDNLNEFELQIPLYDSIKDNDNDGLLNVIVEIWNNKRYDFYKLYKFTNLQHRNKVQYFNRLAMRLANSLPARKQFTKKICQFSVTGFSSENDAHAANVLMFFSSKNEICILYVDDGYLTSRDLERYMDEPKRYVEDIEHPTKKERQFMDKFDIFYNFYYKYGLNITDYKFKRDHGIVDRYNLVPGRDVIHIRPDDFFVVYEFTERNRIGFKEPQKPKDPPQQKGGLLSSFFKKLCIIILIFVVILCIVIYIHDHYFNRQYIKRKINNPKV